MILFFFSKRKKLVSYWWNRMIILDLFKMVLKLGTLDFSPEIGLGVLCLDTKENVLCLSKYSSRAQWQTVLCIIGSHFPFRAWMELLFQIINVDIVRINGNIQTLHLLWLTWLCAKIKHLKMLLRATDEKQWCRCWYCCCCDLKPFITNLLQRKLQIAHVHTEVRSTVHESCLFMAFIADEGELLECKLHLPCGWTRCWRPKMQKCT